MSQLNTTIASELTKRVLAPCFFKIFRVIAVHVELKCVLLTYKILNADSAHMEAILVHISGRGES